MSGRQKTVTREILITMTNIVNTMKEAEEDLATHNLAKLCENLKKVENIASSLRAEIEVKYGVTTP